MQFRVGASHVIRIESQRVRHVAALRTLAGDRPDDGGEHARDDVDCIWPDRGLILALRAEQVFNLSANPDIGRHDDHIGLIGSSL